MIRGRGFFCIVPLLSMLAGCGALVRVSHKFEMSAEWRDYQKVAVRTTNGRVELSPYDGAEVRIEGVKQAGALTIDEAVRRLDALEITAEADPAEAKTMRIAVEMPDEWRNASCGAELRILVPRSCAADVSTGNGSIRVSRMSNGVSLRTSNGRIEADGIEGRLEAATSNGSVRVEGVHGDFTASTSNGSVVARSVSGTCNVTTSNGSVRVEDARGDVTVETSNGGIHVDGSPPDEAQIVLRSSNASVEAELPGSLKGELSLRTQNGHVKIEDVPMTVSHMSRTYVEGLLNGGGKGRVRMGTSNGNVTVRRRQ